MSDTMLLGVLRMPFDLAMSTTTSRMQYHRRGVQAADEIEQRTRERNEARAEVERLREALTEISQYETTAPAGFEWDIIVEELVKIARKALGGKP